MPLSLHFVCSSILSQHLIAITIILQWSQPCGALSFGYFPPPFRCLFLLPAIPDLLPVSLPVATWAPITRGFSRTHDLGSWVDFCIISPRHCPPYPIATIYPCRHCFEYAQPTCHHPNKSSCQFYKDVILGLHFTNWQSTLFHASVSFDCSSLFLYLMWCI